MELVQVDMAALAAQCWDSCVASLMLAAVLRQVSSHASWPHGHPAGWAHDVMVFDLEQVCRAEQHQQQLCIQKPDGTIRALRLEAGMVAVLHIGGSLVLTQQQLGTLTLNEYRHITVVSIGLPAFESCSALEHRPHQVALIISDINAFSFQDVKKHINVNSSLASSQMHTWAVM